MTLPTPDQIRSRQTAYVATEAWWKTRVEQIAKDCREAAKFWRQYPDATLGTAENAHEACAKALEALIAERPSR